MSCLVCSGQPKTAKIKTNGDCLDAAFDTIRSHFLFYKDAAETKGHEIEKLLQRNSKLTKAVKLLQHESDQLSQSQNYSPLPRKRRKASSLDSSTKAHNASQDNASNFLAEDKHNSTDDDVTIVEDVPAAAPAPEFNMALHSEQLDMSSYSPSNNESIGETEKVPSPRHLRILNAWGTKRRERMRSSSKSPLLDLATRGEQKRNILTLKEKKNELEAKKNELETKKSELETKKNELEVKKTEWKMKERASPVPLAWGSPIIAESENVAQKSEDASTSHMAAQQEKKSKLTLSKLGAKLKQTRLQFDVPKRNVNEADNTFCDGVIEESPNAASTSKATKASKWMLRTGNESTHLDTASVKVANENDDEDEVFHFLNQKSQTPNTSPEKCKLSVDETILTDATDSSSVVAMTPAPTEIIFLDESSLDFDTELLSKLKEVEELGMQSVKKKEEVASCSKQKTATREIQKDSKKAKIAANQPTVSRACAHITVAVPQLKQEKVTQEPLNDKTSILENEENCSDNSEEFLVRPILVKEEKSTPKKLSIKERFNIDCRDCQKYIDFLADRLSDAEIEAHLRQCTRHKENEANLRLTPEGFWNPLLESFAEDDPRNEVLVDTRFVGKKRGSN